MMTHQEKVEHFERLLAERGYWVSNAIPPLHRLLWSLGFETPPPYFLSPLAGFLLAGLPFALFWGAFMYVSLWSHWSFLQVSVVALATGGAFGFVMAAFWRYQAVSLKLPRWSEYPSDAENSN